MGGMGSSSSSSSSSGGGAPLRRANPRRRPAGTPSRTPAACLGLEDQPQTSRRPELGQRAARTSPSACKCNTRSSQKKKQRVRQRGGRAPRARAARRTCFHSAWVFLADVLPCLNCSPDPMRCAPSRAVRVLLPLPAHERPLYLVGKPLGIATMGSLVGSASSRAAGTNCATRHARHACTPHVSWCCACDARQAQPLLRLILGARQRARRSPPQRPSARGCRRAAAVARRAHLSLPLGFARGAHGEPRRYTARRMQARCRPNYIMGGSLMRVFVVNLRRGRRYARRYPLRGWLSGGLRGSPGSGIL